MTFSRAILNEILSEILSEILNEILNEIHSGILINAIIDLLSNHDPAAFPMSSALGPTMKWWTMERSGSRRIKIFPLATTTMPIRA